MASVTRGEPLDGVPTADYAAVGMFGHGIPGTGSLCSAVAVLDGRHILTTRHCVTTTGAITGPARDPADFWFQTGGMTYRAMDLYADFGGDLALLRLDGVVPNAFDLWNAADGSELGQIFHGVGFGGTDANGDGRWGPGGQGVKRVFANVIDEIVLGPISGQGQVLRYDFDLTSAESVGDSEGLHGPGDSGGAALLPDDSGGSWLLAGLMSSAGAPVNGSTGSLVQISSYRDAIIATVPEPATIMLFAASSIMLLIRCRAVTVH